MPNIVLRVPTGSFPGDCRADLMRRVSEAAARAEQIPDRPDARFLTWVLVDEVAPGRVHRIIYERMVEDTEAEVRRLLAYCGLEFEPACMRFYENQRAVRTASSEQVRRPIFRDAVEQWRHYEPWLGPLKAVLGPVLEAYPAAS